MEPVSEEEVLEWLESSDEEDEAPPAVPQDAATKYASSQLRVVRETKDYQLDYLSFAMAPGKEIINTAPAYQRRLRWSNKKRSLLIESFLLNIPVPPIFLFEHDYNAYEVIDGRQRLEAIKAFLSNDFPLTGLEYWPELNGKRYNSLPGVIQKGLLRRSLPAVVLLAETTDAAFEDVSVRQVLFDRLNTGGIKLNAQELRNALFPGSLNSLLISLARSNEFTSVWGIPAFSPDEDDEPSEALIKNPLYAKLGDAELVLRVFALRDAVAGNKKGSLRRILDRYMKANAKLPNSEIEKLRTLFLSCLKRLSSVFDGNPFILPTTNRRSGPLYDALMVALSMNPKDRIENDAKGIQERLRASLDDPDQYDVLVGRGNTIESVRERVRLASTILFSGLA